jgi:hypothetical protein
VVLTAVTWAPTGFLEKIKIGEEKREETQSVATSMIPHRNPKLQGDLQK